MTYQNLDKLIFLRDSIYVFNCTYTSDCSYCDGARYEAQAIIHADVERGGPAGTGGG